MSIRPQLTHLGIYCSDIAAMEQFYTQVIGLMVTDRGFTERQQVDLVFLSANPQSHHQLVLVAERPPRRRESNVHQISFKMQSLDELKGVAARLTQAAVAPLRPIDHGNAWSVYSTDPEGNGLEFYMDTPWQVAQPHGDPLDLGLAQDVLLRITEARVRADPTFQPREAWMAQFADRLAGP